MTTVRILTIIGLIFFGGLLFLAMQGCAPMMGGGFYDGKGFDPATGNVIWQAKVHSVRECERASILITPDGTFSANVTGIKSGDNTAKDAIDLGREVIEFVSKGG